MCKESEREIAWGSLVCYMECHSFESYSCDFLKKYYVGYYAKGLYCNPIMRDIYENNKEACKILFEV